MSTSYPHHDYRLSAPAPAMRLHTYPLADESRNDLIALWRTAWTRTDYDWLEAMCGDYQNDLTITSVVEYQNEEAIASATVSHAVRKPQVALLGSVVTAPRFQGQGAAGRVIEKALEYACKMGCISCYLGSKARKKNVYLKHDFDWVSGNVMRKSLVSSVPSETERFKPGRRTVFRPAHWGDLPGFTLLSVQPLETDVLDFTHSAVSIKTAPPERCVSFFPTLWENAQKAGGQLIVLADADEDRPLGFASFIPGLGSARRHRASVDAVVHDAYADDLPGLLSDVIHRARQADVQIAEACIANTDEIKLQHFEQAGFLEIAKIPQALRLRGVNVEARVLQCVLS